MFKEILSKSADKVFSGVKKTGSYLGGLALEESAAMVARRSPLLGDYAHKMLNKIQAARELNKVRTASAKNYIESSNSDASSEFKAKVKANSKEGASDKAIEKDMISILTKLQAMVDKTGKEEAKKSDFFKTYEKYFEDYKKQEEEAIKSSEKDKSKESPDASSDPQQVLDGDQLDAIETNTKETVEVLSKLAAGDLDGKVPNAEVAKTNQPGVIPAIDKLGGKLIDKFVTDKLFKPKDKNNPAKSAPNVSANNSGSEPSNGILPALAQLPKSIIGKVFKSKDQNSLADKEADAEDKKPNFAAMLIVLGDKLVTAIDKLGALLKDTIGKRADPLKDRADALDIDIDKPTRGRGRSKRTPNGKKSTSKLNPRNRSLTPTADSLNKASKAGGILPDRTTVPKTTVRPAGGGRLGSLLSGGARAASAYALPALGVAAAGAAGYGVGTLINSGISSGLSAVTGKETSLGSWLYDKFNDDPETQQAKYEASPEGQAQIVKAREAATKRREASLAQSAVPNVEAAKSAVPNVEAAKSAVPNVEAAKSTLVLNTLAALNKKEAAAQNSSAAAIPPIIVNNTSSGGGGGSSGSTIVSASPIRNIESSFERVQMQDFWPRAA